MSSTLPLAGSPRASAANIVVVVGDGQFEAISEAGKGCHRAIDILPTYYTASGACDAISLLLDERGAPQTLLRVEQRRDGPRQSAIRVRDLWSEYRVVRPRLGSAALSKRR